MNQHFKSNERELVKVATFFKKRSRKLIEAGKLGEEHRQVEEAVDRFIEQMEDHANTRAALIAQREALRKLVKDHPACPRCNTSDKLKLSGTEKNEKGWTSNRYKCRKCNIQFTWNRPNNPWDMIAYIEEVIGSLQQQLNDERVGETQKEQIASGIASMQGHLGQLKPVIEAHDEEYRRIQDRDAEMEKIIHEFRNTLLIEKIKMDTWENKNLGTS
jgi:hypothetical protein